MPVCPECRNVRFVETEPNTNTVRPCSRCRPEQYEKWSGGGYMPSWVESERTGRELEPDEAHASLKAIRLAAGIERQPH